jgi:hypothetical protein
MQNNDDDMVIDHQVSVCACQMQIEGDNELDEDLDQGFCHEDLDEGFDEGFCDEDAMDEGFCDEDFDQDWDQGFAQSEIHIEFPEGASIGFTFVNGIRYLVLHSNM